MTMQRSGGLPMASLDVSCLLKTVGARNSCARAKDSARGEQAEEKRGQGSGAAMMTGPKPSSDKFGLWRALWQRIDEPISGPDRMRASGCPLHLACLFSIVERSFEPPAQRQRVEAGARGAIIHSKGLGPQSAHVSHAGAPHGRPSLKAMRSPLHES